SEKDGDGSVNKTAIAGEYNGGILIFDDEEHMTGDEEKDMAISDELASIIDSITYDNFESQTMFESYVGTFVADEGKITLNEDHTGTLSLQDNIDINWSTHEITAVDGSFNYEFATEGGDIQLNLDDMWIDFKKE
ncbi:MAG: hypothetical protein K5894_08495, partial [Lachnospiraceae bacterium]|nr:hypothetical protein [Lachnospiraceae bacterium]